MLKHNEYGQFCPVAKTAEILAVKWMPLVIRELLSGSYRFNDLQRGVPLMSPSLLSTRLKVLEDSGFVRRNPAKKGRGHEYHLTEAGKELGPIVEMYGDWAQTWLQQKIADQDLDPSLLMWDIRRNLDAAHFPTDRRASVQFELTGAKAKQRRWWVVFEEGEADLCMKDPGHEVDLYISSPLRALTEVWIGKRSISGALKSGELVLDGPRKLVDTFPNWFLLSATAR